MIIVLSVFQHGMSGVIHRAWSDRKADHGGPLTWDAPVNRIPVTGLSTGVWG